MGDEARCIVLYGGRSSEGRALLETDELVFRGDFRLAIPRADIRSTSEDDGRLVVEFAGGTATFVLGSRASRWAEKIRNPKTLLDKLGIRQGSRVSVVGVEDEAFHTLLHERGIRASARPRAGSDVVIFQARSAQDLGRIVGLATHLKPNGALWVVAPKGGAEPREAQVLEAGKGAGLVDTKVARFSDTHAAHKFVIPVARR